MDTIKKLVILAVVAFGVYVLYTKIAQPFMNTAETRAHQLYGDGTLPSTEDVERRY